MSTQPGAADRDPSPRLPRAGALSARTAWTALALLCVWAGLAAMKSPEPAQDSGKFKHGKGTHVWDYWNKPSKPGGDIEYMRDCRGCHDYAQGRTAPADPQAVCRNCHYGPAGLVVEPASADSLLPRSGSSFKRHQQHDNLACSECHSLNEARDHLTAKTGYASCAECHGEAARTDFKVVVDAEKPRTIDPKKIKGKLSDQLNQDALFRLSTEGSFEHADHMSAEDMKAGGTKCNECHKDVRTSDASTLENSQFDQRKCGDCHQIQPEKAVKIGRDEVTRPSVAALTFDHKDHFRGKAPKEQNCKPGAFEAIQTQDCLACHVNDESMRPASFAVRADRAKYAGCMTCHAERFFVREHGKWAVCDACHTFGTGEMETNRVSVDVDRVLAGTVRFKMPAQKHPGIVGKPGDDCSACHRAAVPELPSRIASTRFDHAPHLASKAGPASCEPCHMSVVGNAQGSVGIGRPWTGPDAPVGDVSSLLTFDLAACNTCHDGISIDAASITQRAKRNVPEFSHAYHLKNARGSSKSATSAECTTCHVVSDERGKNVTTPGNVANCTLCHGHDDQHALATRDIRESEVKSCELCHDKKVPKPGDTLTALRSVAMLQEPQFHPSDAKCEKCHSFGSSGELAKIEVASLVAPKNQRARTPHKNDYESSSPCVNCHWAKPPDTGTKVDADFPTPETRKKFGQKLDVFPGGPFHYRPRPESKK